MKPAPAAVLQVALYWTWWCSGCCWTKPPCMVGRPLVHTAVRLLGWGADSALLGLGGGAHCGSAGPGGADAAFVQGKIAASALLGLRCWCHIALRWTADSAVPIRLP
jgi:hypothetical protein